MNVEKRARLDAEVKEFFATEEGEQLVEFCRNECINGINEWDEDFHLDPEFEKEMSEHMLSGRFSFHLYKRVAEELVLYANQQATEADMRGDDDDDDE